MFRKLNKYIFVYASILLIVLFLIYSKSKSNIEYSKDVSFYINDGYIDSNESIIFESSIIPQPKFLKVSHASSIEVLKNGDLIATWFAGSHEGKPDVRIWQSKFRNENWSYAYPIITRQTITDEDGRFTSKLGNPVIYLDDNNKLHLFLVSVGLIGGWSGSSLNHFISVNNGNSWEFNGKLYLSPFANISSLDRAKAVPLANGGFYLPIYHEMIRKYPEVLHFDNNANFISQIRLTANNNLIQPAILPISSKVAFAYLRNSNNKDNTLYYQITNDGGLTWSNLLPTNLKNQDSSIVVDRVKESEYLMVHNEEGRNQLYLSWSNDGIKWKNIYLIESNLGDEYSYPTIQVKNGLIDITYTYNRQGIKHLRINLNWLYKQININVKGEK